MTFTPHVRPVTPSDVEAILIINRAGVPGVTRLSHPALAELLALSSYCRVTEINDEVVGYVIALAAAADYSGDEFRWFRAQYADFLYIDQLAVAPHWRRNRVASLLYGDIEAHAHERNIRRLTCEVNLRPANAVSLQFHSAQGYAEVGTLTTQDGRLVSLRLKDLQLEAAEEDTRP